VLTDSIYRKAAVRARDEIQAMPSPGDLVSGIEALVNTRALTLRLDCCISGWLSAALDAQAVGSGYPRRA
jgi:hypothetical protein